MLPLLFGFAPVFGQQTINLLFKPGQIILDRSPSYFQIYKEILVNGSIAHGRHLRPRNLGMPRNQIRRQILNLVYGLTDNLDVAHHGVLNLLAFWNASSLCRGWM